MILSKKRLRAKARGHAEKTELSVCHLCRTKKLVKRIEFEKLLAENIELD